MEKDFYLPVTALSSNLGGEITGIDVREIGASVPFGIVEDVLFEQQLLCFRDQILEPTDLLAFTRLFGEPLPHVLQQFSLRGHPEIYVLSNIIENDQPIGNTREGFGWHTDLAYMAKPAAYTILYGIEVPQEGGKTLFASFYRMWDSLEEETKGRLRMLHGRYSYLHLYSQRTNVEPLTAEQKARTPDVLHPFSRLHPRTGREGLYIGGDDLIGVEGSNDHDQDLSRIWQLFEEMTVRFRYSHKWRVNDLLIWDNRGLVHTATDYDTERERRLVWRTSVIGEVPFGPPTELGHLRPKD